MKFHGYNPEEKGESDDGQKVNIEGQVTAVPCGISGYVSEIRKRRNETDRSRRFWKIAQWYEDTADKQEGKLDKRAQHLIVLWAADRGNR